MSLARFAVNLFDKVNCQLSNNPGLSLCCAYYSLEAQIALKVIML